MTIVSLTINQNLNSSQEEVLERFMEFQDAMINKDEERLDEIMDNAYTLTHMSGKTQTKQEFIEEIMNGTLNYYKSTIINPQITIIDEKHATLNADVELDAKVYGIKGTWTLNTIITMKKTKEKWILYKWDN